MSKKAAAQKAADAKGSDTPEPTPPADPEVATDKPSEDTPEPDAQPPEPTPPEPKPPETKPARHVIPPKKAAPKNAKPFSADGTKDIKPVAKGVECVVVNPKARCFVLSGVDGVIKPGRNTCNTAQVTAAMRTAPARRLGLYIEELGDPETETQTQKILNLGNTYDADVLKEVIDSEKDQTVVAAAKTQLRKVCPPKEDLEKDGDNSGE